MYITWSEVTHVLHCQSYRLGKPDRT